MVLFYICFENGRYLIPLLMLWAFQLNFESTLATLRFFFLRTKSLYKLTAAFCAFFTGCAVSESHGQVNPYPWQDGLNLRLQENLQNRSKVKIANRFTIINISFTGNCCLSRSIDIIQLLCYNFRQVNLVSGHVSFRLHIKGCLVVT